MSNLFPWAKMANRARMGVLETYRGELTDNQLYDLAHIMKWRDSAIRARNSEGCLVVFQLPQLKQGTLTMGVPDSALVGKINAVIMDHLNDPQP